VLTVLVDLLLQFHGLLVERAGRVGKNLLAGLLVEEIFVDSGFVESCLLVGQGKFKVVAERQVFLNSVFVELVVLVFQSLLEVLLLRQVNLGLVVVENALGSLVVRAVGVGKCFLQVLRLAKVLQDGEVVELALLVEECVVVEFDILEFLSSDLLCAVHCLLVLGQENVLGA